MPPARIPTTSQPKAAAHRSGEARSTRISSGEVAVQASPASKAVSLECRAPVAWEYSATSCRWRFPGLGEIASGGVGQGQGLAHGSVLTFSVKTSRDLESQSAVADAGVRRRRQQPHLGEGEAGVQGEGAQRFLESESCFTVAFGEGEGHDQAAVGGSVAGRTGDHLAEFVSGFVQAPEVT